MCALTSRKEILVAYFGSMVLAVLAVSLASNLVEPPVVMDLPLPPGFAEIMRIFDERHGVGKNYDL